MLSLANVYWKTWLLKSTTWCFLSEKVSCAIFKMQAIAQHSHPLQYYFFFLFEIINLLKNLLLLYLVINVNSVFIDWRRAWKKKVYLLWVVGRGGIWTTVDKVTAKGRCTRNGRQIIIPAGMRRISIAIHPSSTLKSLPTLTVCMKSVMYAAVYSFLLVFFWSCF